MTPDQDDRRHRDLADGLLLGAELDAVMRRWTDLDVFSTNEVLAAFVKRHQF